MTKHKQEQWKAECDKANQKMARKIVADWLGEFDPPPPIDFQQSEVSQMLIVRALDEVVRLCGRT
jgi:hypothetical protein